MQTVLPFELVPCPVPGSAGTQKDCVRLLGKLDRSGGPDSCWLFQGALNSGGYGLFWFQGEGTRAHFAAFRLFVGEVPPDTDLRQSCRNAACANPAHLVLRPRPDLLALSAAAAAAGKKPPWMPERELIAWAGGLFEGEGCVTVTRQDGHAPTFTVMLAMTDQDSVQRFADAVGVGRVRGPYGPYRPNEKALWQWRISRYEESQAVVAMLWPWLGRRRQARATEIMAAGKAGQIPTRSARETACAKGHPWLPETTYTDKKTGKRSCRICLRVHWRNADAKKRERRLAAPPG